MLQYVNAIVFFFRDRFVSCELLLLRFNSFLFFIFEKLFVGSDLCPLLLATDASSLFFFVNKREKKNALRCSDEAVLTTRPSRLASTTLTASRPSALTLASTWEKVSSRAI